MALIPINIPPGVYRNGTELQSTGRWYDTNLVRWTEGAMLPVGGWERRGSFSLTGKCRGLITWKTNGGVRFAGFGTSSKLYVMTQSNILVDITPTRMLDCGIRRCLDGFRLRHRQLQRRILWYSSPRYRISNRGNNLEPRYLGRISRWLLDLGW